MPQPPSPQPPPLSWQGCHHSHHHVLVCSGGGGGTGAEVVPGVRALEMEASSQEEPHTSGAGATPPLLVSRGRHSPSRYSHLPTDNEHPHPQRQHPQSTHSPTAEVEHQPSRLQPSSAGGGVSSGWGLVASTKAGPVRQGLVRLLNTLLHRAQRIITGSAFAAREGVMQLLHGLQHGPQRVANTMSGAVRELGHPPARARAM